MQQRSLIPLPSNERDPWRYLSDEELAAVISGWGNGFILGVKESGADAGVDEQGNSITSPETVQQMKIWLGQQGMTITWEGILLPVLGGIMEGESALVTMLRAHENVDYLNPDGPGEPDGGESMSSLPRLISAFFTAPEGFSGLSVRTGDVVTAEYRQPNGAVLRASVSVR